MALTQRLEFRQSQSLVMTPQLMQAIKLLQLSNLDLSTFVEEELERNPLLERANDGPEAPVAGEQQMSERSEFSDAGEAGGEDFGDGGGAAGESFDGAPEDWMSRDLGTRTEIEQTLDTGLDNVFSEEPAETAARNAQDAAPTTYTEWGGGASGDEDYNLEAFVAAETTLSDHLAEQAAVAFTAPADRMIGQYLIDLVDEAGYLPADLGQAADRLGAEQADVDAVLGVLQTFDPPGICARNLSECLAIQLRELDRYDPVMQALVEHLDILAKRDFASLRKLCGVDDEDLVDMIGEIRRLDPKPGLKFGTTRTQTMVPDVYVRPGPDGG
ncbi:MAG: RNA polymerase sigma-54 factor, partial [Bradyrhizobium sp.]|nr:RNA polymerase sigma-54 factor [Bradyrhizobium sp.]